MRIRDTFRNDIGRRIEEVVKVDVSDDDVVAEEIAEYVVTTRIEESLRDLLEVYRETIGNPEGRTNVWVSGFFGSGKSNFAKVLGYLLENRAVGTRRAADLFLPRCNDPAVAALLQTSWKLAPAITVFLELSSSQDVTSEAEGLVPPMYRALLARLGYAQAPKLAALEFDLETDGRLDAFEAAFAQTTGKIWRDARHTTLAVNAASRALNALDPSTFPSPEAWSRDFEAPALTAKWFVRRALDLLQHRGQGATRLVFVIDEVSQYIARSIDRIRAMQAVAEEFKALGGRLWLVATGQERLEEVVEGLEGKQSELQRLRDRFPLTVDLLPSDIKEVVARRVLDKTDTGRSEIAAVLRPHREQLAANTRLRSETRAGDPSEEEWLRLYPLVPYQVQLIIDAVSKRRSQVRTSAPMGGSSRTLIKHAQQLVTSSRVGLGDAQVGALVTMDRSYELLLEVIPTSWRAEIDQVTDQYGQGSVEWQIMAAVALVHDVPALPLTAHNIAVLLHPGIVAESRLDEVAAALGRLVATDRLRETDRGFQLQSLEQKRWDQERKEIALGLGDELRLRKQLLKSVLEGVTVSLQRSFSVGLTVDGEAQSSGDVSVDVVAATHADHGDELRELSRESANANRIYWIYRPDPDEAWRALEDLHRSRRMIERHDTPAKSATDAQLVADEKNRQSRAERKAVEALSRDLSGGEIIFRGQSSLAPAGESRAVLQGVVRDRLPAIYPRIDSFAAAVDAKDAILVLRSEDLALLPESLSENGIGLTVMTPSGAELVTQADPLAAYLAEVRRRTELGQASNGQVLERHFGDPPYGAPVGVVQVLTAAALRAGLVEVVHQGQRIAAPSDRRLDQVFRTLPAFRQTEMRPPRETGPDAATRTRLAARLQSYTGEPQSPQLEELARRVRAVVTAQATAVRSVFDQLTGAGLTVPPPIDRARLLVGWLETNDDGEVVVTAAGNWEDLVAGMTAAGALGPRLAEELAAFRAAREVVALGTAGLGAEVAASAERLADLLASGDYLAHAGEIRSLAEDLVDARRRLVDDLRGRLTADVARRASVLRNDFEAVDEAQLAEALRILTDLVPAEGVEIPVEVWQARLVQAGAASAEARRLLEELAAQGRLVEVRVSDIVPRPVESPADLEQALNAIRRAVAGALGDDKVVKLT